MIIEEEEKRDVVICLDNKREPWVREGGEVGDFLGQPCTERHNQAHSLPWARHLVPWSSGTGLMTTKIIPFPEPDTWYLGLQVQGYDHQAHSLPWARHLVPGSSGTGLWPPSSFPSLSQTPGTWVFRYMAMPTKLIPFPEPDTWYLGLQVQGYAHQAHSLPWARHLVPGSSGTGLCPPSLFPSLSQTPGTWAFRYRAMPTKFIPFPEPDTWYLGLEVQGYAHQAHSLHSARHLVPGSWGTGLWPPSSFSLHWARLLFLGLQVQGYDPKAHSLPGAGHLELLGLPLQAGIV